jgi:hypothetical protein
LITVRLAFRDAVSGMWSSTERAQTFIMVTA